MNKRTVVYYSIDSFVDTDVTVVNELQKTFRIEWFVLLSANHPYTKEDLEDIVKDSGVKPHIYVYKCRRRSFAFLKIVFSTIILIRKLNASLLFTNCKDFYFTLLRFTLLRKLPQLVGIHDAAPHPDIKMTNFLRFSSKLVNKLSKSFLFYSKSQYKVFEGLYPGKKMYLAGMSSKGFGDVGRQIPFDQDSIKLLFFGTIQEYKGYKILIKAYERIIEDGITNLTLSFYGKPADNSVSEWIFKNITDKDKYDLHLGFIDNADIPAIFTNSNFALFPYRDASQSGPSLIAVYYGIPILATNNLWFKEIVNNNNEGVLFEWTEEAIYETLKEISKITKEQYSDMLASCQARKKKFSEEEIGKKYVEIFNSILK